VDIATLGPTTVQVVAESGDHIRGIRRIGNFNKGIVRFLPDPSFIPFAVHSIRVFDELRDTTGRSLDRDYEFRFETVPATPVLLVQTQIQDLGDLMQTGRWFHRMTRQSDGRILIAGGYVGGQTVTNRAEVLDPVTRQVFQLGDPMNNARANHVQVLLNDGRILLAGGETQDNPFTPIADCEIYDPVTREFTLATPMAFSRSVAHAVVLPDGRAVVTGGQSLSGGNFIFRDDIEIYDPASDTWSLVAAPMARGRSGHFSAVTPTGDVVIIGGSSTTPSADLFRPPSETFQLLFGQPLNAHLFPAATLLPDGRPLLASGSGSKRITFWDQTFGFQITITDMANERTFGTAHALSDGRTLLVGGTDFNVVPPLLQSSIDVIHPVGSALKVVRVTGAVLPRVTSHHAGAVAFDGTTYITGGLPQNFAAPALRQIVAILKDPP
jgi:hypothetical protein